MDREAWNAYVASHPGGTFYHLFDWQNVNRIGLKAQSSFLIARRATDVVGILPLSQVSSALFGRILCSMPFVNFGGPCASDAETTLALLEEAANLAGQLKSDYVELRCAEALETSWQVSLRKISMTLELTPDPDTLWNTFSSKQRTAIRRSYKNELSVRSGGAELLPIFYRVMQESWRALGTPLYHPRYFQEIFRAFGEKTRIFICEQRGIPVAVALNGYFNGTVEGMWAGGTAASRPLQANYVLYWEMMKDACERGFQHYHLGRSTAESGAEEFKKKWNATARQLYWYYNTPPGTPLPGLNVDNPKYRMAIATWQRLPMWVTRLAGPPLARLIP